MNELIRKCIGTSKSIRWNVLDTVDDVGQLGTRLKEYCKREDKKKIKRGLKEY